MKSLPALGMKQFASVEDGDLGPVKYKFSSPNIFKIKHKILVNFSVGTQNA